MTLFGTLDKVEVCFSWNSLKIPQAVRTTQINTAQSWPQDGTPGAYKCKSALLPWKRALCPLGGSEKHYSQPHLKVQLKAQHLSEGREEFQWLRSEGPVLHSEYLGLSQCICVQVPGNPKITGPLILLSSLKVRLWRANVFLLLHERQIYAWAELIGKWNTELPMNHTVNAFPYP